MSHQFKFIFNFRTQLHSIQILTWIEIHVIIVYKVKLCTTFIKISQLDTFCLHDCKDQRDNFSQFIESSTGSVPGWVY